MRYWEFISAEELNKKINEIRGREGYDGIFTKLTGGIEKDLSKVEFDSENINIEKGVMTLSNGMVYQGAQAGGDWEQAVFFIVYWDGKKLRGYIPKDGNMWNTDTKQAYGNNNEKDFKNVKKLWPNDKYWKNITLEEFCSDMIDNYDMELMKKEIMNHIVKKDSKNKNVILKNKRSVYDRLKELKFYYPNNEFGRLFGGTCNLCYLMEGIGEDKKAELLYKWALAQVKLNNKQIKEEGESLDGKDFILGF